MSSTYHIAVANQESRTLTPYQINAFRSVCEVTFQAVIFRPVGICEYVVPIITLEIEVAGEADDTCYKQHCS